MLSRTSNLGRELARLGAKLAGLEESPAKKKFSLFA
jgi:hypothetical protein